MANSWLLSIFGFLLTANISFADIGVNQRMDIWDSNGQLQNVLRPCSGDVRHHWWNENGQLTATVDNHYCSYFGYDGNGERVYKLTGQSMLDQYNAGEQNFQMYFNDAVMYVNPYMIVTPTGYTKHYYNGSQRIATRIGELEHLPGDIIDTSAVALERITNAREYMHEMLNVSAVQAVDTASVFADIEGNGQEDLQWQCMEDAEWMFHAVIHCDSNLLYPILTMDSTHLNQEVQGIYYYHPDHLGSANWITDLDERPVEYLHYMPYGEPWQEQHRTTYDERYKFTGKERDAETKYDYFGARYYASVLPTWLSVDPLSDKYPSISPYAYCNWNPITHIDPNGQWVETAWDVANIALDVQSFWTNIQTGNVGAAVVDGAALVLDAAATLIPAIPGGAGTALKAARGADKVTDVATIATKYNYRQVLQKVTGKVGKGYEAHHTLPQKHRDRFEKLDINIDEPGNVVWRESKEHRANNYKHTKKWDAFWKQNPNPTKEEVLKKRNEIEETFYTNPKGDNPVE